MLFQPRSRCWGPTRPTKRSTNWASISSLKGWKSKLPISKAARTFGISYSILYSRPLEKVPLHFMQGLDKIVCLTFYKSMFLEKLILKNIIFAYYHYNNSLTTLRIYILLELTTLSDLSWIVWSCAWLLTGLNPRLTFVQACAGLYEI